MKITWIGQSGYKISTEQTTIYIDPYLSDVVNRVANGPRLVETPLMPDDVHADAIICTHNHLDHLDIDAIQEMNRELCFITTTDGKETLQKMGFFNVRAVVVGETVVVGDIEVTAVFAKHTVEAFGVIINAEGNVLYFSGDTLYDEKLFVVTVFEPDIAFVCINGKQREIDKYNTPLPWKREHRRISVRAGSHVPSKLSQNGNGERQQS